MAGSCVGISFFGNICTRREAENRFRKLKFRYPHLGALPEGRGGFPRLSVVVLLPNRIPGAVRGAESQDSCTRESLWVLGTIENADWSPGIGFGACELCLCFCEAG